MYLSEVKKVRLESKIILKFLVFKILFFSYFASMLKGVFAPPSPVKPMFTLLKSISTIGRSEKLGVPSINGA